MQELGLFVEVTLHFNPKGLCHVLLLIVSWLLYIISAKKFDGYFVQGCCFLVLTLLYEWTRCTANREEHTVNPNHCQIRLLYNVRIIIKNMLTEASLYYDHY